MRNLLTLMLLATTMLSSCARPGPSYRPPPAVPAGPIIERSGHVEMQIAGTFPFPVLKAGPEIYVLDVTADADVSPDLTAQGGMILWDLREGVVYLVRGWVQGSAPLGTGGTAPILRVTHLSIARTN